MQTGQGACETCKQALSYLPIQEKHCLTIDLDIGLICLCTPPIEDRKEKRKEKLEEITKNVTALKNSGGGALCIHFQGIHQEDRCFSYFNELVDEKLTNLLENGELFVDSYSKHWVYRDTHTKFLAVTVRASIVLSTADFKTKVPSDESITRPTSKNIALLLFGKCRPPCKPKIRGLADLHQENHQLQLKYFDNCLFKCGLPKVLHYVWYNLRLREYFTTFSKIHEGGSYYLGGKENKEKFVTSERNYETKRFDFTGVKLKQHLHELFLAELQKLVKDNIFAPLESDPDITSLYTAKFHPIDAGKDLYVLEVAVGSVSRCIFYEKEGPEAYRILDDGNIERLSFKKWTLKMRESWF